MRTQEGCFTLVCSHKNSTNPKPFYTVQEGGLRNNEICVDYGQNTILSTTESFCLMTAERFRLSGCSFYLLIEQQPGVVSPVGSCAWSCSPNATFVFQAPYVQRGMRLLG